MSRVDDLIREHCPEGVPTLPMNEVGDFIRGNGLQKKDFVETGFPCIHYGQIYTHYGLQADQTKSFVAPELGHKLRKAAPGDVLIATTSENLNDVCKSLAWLGDSEIAVSGDMFIYRTELNAKFVVYLMQTERFQIEKNRRATGTKVLRLSADQLGKIAIPVPPLEVQREIVRILDEFTALEAELEAELEARRKQYEHYRETLLFGADFRTEYSSVSTLCEVSRGKVISKDYLRDHPGTFPVYSSQTQNKGVFGLIDSYDYDFESITWTTDGANAGSVFFHQDEKFSITNVCGLLRVKEPSRVSARYLFHQLGSRAKKYVSSGMGNPKLMADAMKRIEIPLPIIEVQREIVGTLDAFDALVNDISIGLPAELAARRKQYEYYRDKLLTFKELTP